MCLIFTVWLNRETFLPSKLLQTTVFTAHLQDLIPILAGVIT